MTYQRPRYIVPPSAGASLTAKGALVWRCPCGFAIIGRDLHQVNEARKDHEAYKQLTSLHLDAHAEPDSTMK